MHRRPYLTLAQGDGPAALAGNGHASLQQRLGSGGPERDDALRVNQSQLVLQPRPAGGHLVIIGLGMQALLAGRGELEMLDRVGQIDLAPLDTGRSQCPIQQLAGRAHERPPRQILGVARLFAHNHQARVRRAFAEHGLRGRPAQATGAA